jgi:hypothetical protein
MGSEFPVTGAKVAYYLNLFSPETYEIFSASDRSVSGFRRRQYNAAQKIHPGDKLICYVTKLSRWIGILDVSSECYIDEVNQIYAETDDPFIVRFKVNTTIWLDLTKAVPIREDEVWETLSFTKGQPKNSSSWTGKLRASLTPVSQKDGKFLEEILIKQARDPRLFPIEEKEYRRIMTPRVHRVGKTVAVSIPEDADKEVHIESDIPRESIRIQALLAEIGDKMGYSIWIPANDRSQVISEWKAGQNKLIDRLPLNYDLATLRTIEQIDVLWLKRRSIVRAFEVEHTTAVYSGILRMADLLALQPNMDIKLHIVAPVARKEKVFQEIKRPVFSLLDRGPLSEICTYISYDSLYELGKQKHLAYLSDNVLEEYEEEVD